MREASGPDPIDVDVGTRLRAARRGRSMSQEALAIELGLTFQQVQKYEKGSNRISASMLVRAARALDMSVADLLPARDEGGAALASPIPLSRGPDVEKLVQAFLQVDPKARRALLTLACSLADAHALASEAAAVDQAA